MAAASSPFAPPARGGPQGRGRTATMLSLTYDNRAFDVTKERFILGRSKSQADLVLDDANVSRQHAAIERVVEVVAADERARPPARIELAVSHRSCRHRDAFR
jgi:hypothetical protein